jgi:hypothetical protein
MHHRWSPELHHPNPAISLQHTRVNASFLVFWKEMASSFMSSKVVHFQVTEGGALSSDR